MGAVGPAAGSSEETRGSDGKGDERRNSRDASFFRRRATRRSAIYVGGPLQLQFGVRGKRWNSMPTYRQLMGNPAWIRPLASEQPPKKNVIEGGAYW